MWKARLAIIALLALLTISPVYCRDWSNASTKAEKSIVGISSIMVETDWTQHARISNVHCTGFSINKSKHYFMTAHHCKGVDMLVDGKTAIILHENPSEDLMVLIAIDVEKPSLKPSTRQIRRGMEVFTLGYGYGLEEPLFRLGHVAHVGIDRDFHMEYGKGLFFILDTPYIGGMSGGPVLDQDGKVVSIVQLGDGVSGLGRPIGVILQHTAKFWHE